MKQIFPSPNTMQKINSCCFTMKSGWPQTSEQIILVSIREIKGELWTTSYTDRICNWNIYKPNQISYLPSQHRLWSVYLLPLSAVTYWIIHSQYFALTIQFCGEASPVLLTSLLTSLVSILTKSYFWSGFYGIKVLLGDFLLQYDSRMLLPAFAENVHSQLWPIAFMYCKVSQQLGSKMADFKV